MQRSVIFEAKYPPISFCMPQKWTNIHFCTSKVTLPGAFGKFQLRAKGVNPPPFFEVANFRQNPVTSHFAETPPLPLWQLFLGWEVGGAE